jgi:hypothetical protein
MQRDLDRSGCGPNAAFVLLYRRTTEGIRDAIRAGEFSDRPFWNQVATAFGRYLVLGINAHVNRELAFVYFRLGAKNRDDHLFVDTALTRTFPIAYPEISARLDPTLAGQAPNDPALSLDVFAWRELAWANAARLAAAPHAAARRAIAAAIERHSSAMARRIKAAFPATAAANRARNAHCAKAGSAVGHRESFAIARFSADGRSQV